MPTSNRPHPTARGGLDVRAPRWSRISVFLFAVVQCGVLGASAVGGLRDGEVGALGLVPMTAVGFFVFGRAIRLRTFTRGDQLVVRNPMRTRTVRRVDIEDVRTGRPQNGPLTFGASVIVLLRDGSMVSLEATLRTGWTAAGRDELIDSRERLLSWARGDQ